MKEYSSVQLVQQYFWKMRRGDWKPDLKNRAEESQTAISHGLFLYERELEMVYDLGDRNVAEAIEIRQMIK